MLSAKNGIWKWIVGILVVVALPAATGAYLGHESRLTRLETTVEIELRHQAETLAEITEKLNRLLERE